MSERVIRIGKRRLVILILTMIVLVAVYAVIAYRAAYSVVDYIEQKTQRSYGTTVVVEEKEKICNANIERREGLGVYALCTSNEGIDFKPILTPQIHPPRKPKPKFGPQASADPKKSGSAFSFD
jgi:hypothetical protein